MAIPNLDFIVPVVLPVPVVFPRRLLLVAGRRARLVVRTLLRVCLGIEGLLDGQSRILCTRSRNEPAQPLWHHRSAPLIRLARATGVALPPQSMKSIYASP
jgi:hypothetical protein